MMQLAETTAILSISTPWDTLVAQLRRVGYQLEDGMLCLGDVVLRRKRGADRDGLQIVVQVCEESRISHRRALQAAVELSVGSLALAGDRFVLHQTLPLLSASAAEVVAAVAFFRGEARRLAALLQHAGDHGFFENYAA
jgi:hypothetical protein